MRIPQTNLQLYRQLTEHGRSSELPGLRPGYELAASLFAGVYRASGKPFIAHLVGTAGVLVEESSPGEMVAAGLLHAAYAQGDFGDGPPGATPVRRRLLAARIGDDAEGLVARYTTMPWKTGDLASKKLHPDSLDALDRRVLTMRLANEVEELFDFAVLHHRDAEARRAEALAALPYWIEWARALGVAAIAGELASIRESVAAYQAPDGSMTDRVRSYRPPAALRPTMLSRSRHAVEMFRRVARRVRGRVIPRARP